jgi:glucosylceramidase
VNSDTSGYLHWWCAQNNTGETAGSDAILVRLARPGSVRIDATSSAENLKVSAFKNINGTVAIPIINAAHFGREVAVQIRGCDLEKGIATAYLADNEHNNSRIASYHLNGSSFQVSVEPRSLTTFFLE